MAGREASAEHAHQFLNEMDVMLEMLEGYKAKLEKLGYSPTAVETMAVDLHRSLVARIV